MASTALPNDDILVEPTPKGLTRSGAHRLDAIDMLRGLVIAIMVLDHVRDFFHIYALSFDPTDPAKTTPLIYLTRWVTHLCAATFVFLAGVSILFQKANGKAPRALAKFLLTRGLWLILLDVTIVTFGFNFAEPLIFLQVFSAIGVSMICMSALALLPAPAVLAVGAALLLAYPFAVPLTAAATGGWAVIRTLAIAPNIIPGTPILAYYAFVPWLSVMCLGFGLGPIYRMPSDQRTPRLGLIAVGLLLAFVLLRLHDGYGDPAPWRPYPTATQTAMSFFNISKYPPSPDYVFATLGISILLFLALEKMRGPLARVLLAYGRTPLFTYVCHIYIAHGMMLAAALILGFPVSVATHTVTSTLVAGTPDGWGFPLGVVYCIWLIVLVLLYPLSRWFEGVKRRRRDWWLSYL